jgi:hypothetical protein
MTVEEALCFIAHAEYVRAEVLLRRKRATLLGGCRGETPRTPPTAGEVAHALGCTRVRPN